MRKLTILLIIIPLFELNAQNLQLSNCDNNITLKDRNSSNPSRVSLGLGAVTPLGSGTYRPMLSVNSNIHIYKILYINVGFDCYSEPKYAQVIIFAPYIGPNIGINFLKDKFTFFGGGGLYIYNLPLIGILYFIRCEYNVEKSFSIGIELKHANFGDDEFAGQPLILTNLYLAIKF